VDEGVSINHVNTEGHTPLSLLAKRAFSVASTFRSIEQNQIFQLLAKNGADVNFLYPVDSFPNENDYKCSILINFVRQISDNYEYLLRELQCFFNFGAKLNIFDS